MRFKEVYVLIVVTRIDDRDLVEIFEFDDLEDALLCAKVFRSDGRDVAVVKGYREVE